MALFTGIDFEVDVELVLVVEGADGLGAALFAVAFGPDLVIDVLSELAEAVGAFVVGDATLHGERVGVLEVDDGTLDGGVGLVRYLALHDPLHGTALLCHDGLEDRDQARAYQNRRDTAGENQ